ncbi:MAG: hypothetical protein IJT70_03655 [Clostridia bacterium]|nr:hypothetical protein [Clostridia bacterium]
MTDLQYTGLYGQLVDILNSSGELDPDIFYAVFDGKIRPMIMKSFSGLEHYFASFDLEDVTNDIFIKLWSGCVPAYFANEKYEHSPTWFLGWCKVVIKNHITSLLRKRSLRPEDTIDDPEHPLNVSDGSDPSKDIVIRESVSIVYRAVLALPSKPEMKLTWYGVYDLVFGREAYDKIGANRLFLKKYGDMPISYLYSCVSDFILSTEWLGIGKDDLAPLGVGIADGERTNDCVILSSLLGDEPLSKISDWIYKINKKLSDSLPGEVIQWDI